MNHQKKENDNDDECVIFVLQQKTTIKQILFSKINMKKTKQKSPEETKLTLHKHHKKWNVFGKQNLFEKIKNKNYFVIFGPLYFFSLCL